MIANAVWNAEEVTQLRARVDILEDEIAVERSEKSR